MEKFEPQQFREELAKEIKDAPKEERKEILEQAKETPEYWQARGEKIKERQDEEEIDDGLGILIKKKTLYHGSGISGIESFNKAEEDTVGSGIYFTSEAKDAIGYARLRSEREKNTQRADGAPVIENSVPTIYESSIEDIKLCDLRKDENVKKVLGGFREVLNEELKKPDLKWFIHGSLERTIETLDSGKIGAGNLKEITQSNGQLFSDYIKSLGYEGLITFEGGEGGNGNHHTYLIFDPEKAKINRENKILSQEEPTEKTGKAKLLEQQIFEQSNLIEIKPEDRNAKGKLLVSPEGSVSKLDEQGWKMVRTEAFKQWFGGSMVVDENGEPLVLYHGSSKKFDKFDVSKAGASSGENIDSGYFGTGFYFTPHQGLAEKYGPVLYKSFLRVNHIQTFSEEHGNVRFDDSPLPENIREEVLKRYKPLQEAEYRRLQEQEEKNKGDWSYISSWNGTDKFEHILSDVIRQVLLDKGFEGVIGYNQVSKLYEYTVFNQDDILVISLKEKSKE